MRLEVDISVQSIVELIEKLTGDGGCPWSQQQAASTLCHYVIEESYEVIDAISEGDLEKIIEESGDLLFATLFTLAAACKQYDFLPKLAIEAVVNKIIRRHPHVFENPRPTISFEELRIQWEKIKAQERIQNPRKSKGLLDSITRSLPVVTRAMKLIELGQSHGFEYQGNSKTVGGRFINLICQGLDGHENVDHLFEEGLSDYEENFKKWVEEKKPEIFL